MSKHEKPKVVRPRKLLPKGQNYVREKLQGKIFLIPSCITVVGVFCGFLAIIKATQGGFEYATMCIYLAFILDGVDGRVARRLKATSEFGREFDSLSDLVAFGVAPAVLVYSWAFGRLADEFGLLVAFLYVVCAATRLARFNVATSEEELPKATFDGLPSPAAAATLASMVYLHPSPINDFYFVALVVFCTISIAFLMVSSLPFVSLKRVKLTQGNPKLNVVALSILVALTWKYSRIVLLTGFVIYVLSGPVLFFARKRYPKEVEKQAQMWS